MNHEFGESLSSESSSSRSESFVNVYDLTEDLVREILMRLPVVDVIKMKRVCKSLYSLINSSDFIAKYSLLDGDRDPYMFISIPFKGTRVVSVSDEDDDDDDATVNRVIHIRPTPTQPQPQAHRLFCYCCCDGVLLVSFVGFKNNCGQFALWNPATGDIKDVPTYDHYKNLSDCDDGGEEYDLYVTNYGCGFDSKTNEYRPFIVLSDKCYSFKTEIEIYSYKKKIWKIIQSSGIISHEIDMVYANGFCHWPGFSRLGGPNGRDVIVSFDVINEIYSLSRKNVLTFCCKYFILVHSVGSDPLRISQMGPDSRKGMETWTCPKRLEVPKSRTSSEGAGHRDPNQFGGLNNQAHSGPSRVQQLFGQSCISDRPRQVV
ncbi:hypothetical protein FEM48_Zijuj01G0053500 [Ziziphus jujuba var. spinosa]|uniref:F-box domain-containing protein n=1 Tax=Ziziphus jujuba var. spinosa TaxID=714518 RepID=A0A978VZC9_ZIZJJ|nr:hypothetical protein FEM48_Zijuj01G0053500 [Ziziphus jujuba var. spinosa]